MIVRPARITHLVIALSAAICLGGCVSFGERSRASVLRIEEAVTVAGEGVGEPFGIAIKDGEIYFSDGEGGRIMKITGDGPPVVFAEGLHTPSSIAFAPDGSLVVADTGRHSIVAVAPNHSVTHVAGIPFSPGSEDGRAAAARFDGPIGIAVRPDGTIVVADTYNDRIRLIRDGVVSTLAGSRQGFADGPADVALLDTPCGVALLGERVVVADSGNRRIRIVELDGSVWTLAGTGEEGITDGRPYDAEFLFPATVATTSDGELFIGDAHAIRAIRGRFASIVETLSSTHRGYADGSAGLSSFGRVSGLVVFGGRLLAADSENSALRAIGPAISQGAVRTVRSRPFDIAAFRSAQPARWPFDPPSARRDIAGTLGEIRGEYRDAGSFVRFHNGLDIAGSYGETAYFIRNEKVLHPESAANFETARELLRLPLIGYVHLRLGRDRAGTPFGDERFKFNLDGGRVIGVRVRRGAVFRAGEPVGTLNSQNHVHLIAGPAGSEHNALAAIDLPGSIDTVPPVIENVSIFADDWSPLETQSAAPRIIIGTRFRVVVQAFDRMDGNPERRRLGVYRIGFKTGASGSLDNGPPAWNITFDKNPDPLAVKFAYAPGSVSGPTGPTVFRYIATNIVDGDRFERSFLDTSPFVEGIYTIRAYAADLSGNTTYKDKVIELVK